MSPGLPSAESLPWCIGRAGERAEQQEIRSRCTGDTMKGNRAQICKFHICLCHCCSPSHHCSGPITPPAPTLYSQVSPPQEALPSDLLNLDAGSLGPLSDFSLSTSVFQESMLPSVWQHRGWRQGGAGGGRVGISERAGQPISAWLYFHRAGLP